MGVSAMKIGKKRLLKDTEQADVSAYKVQQIQHQPVDWFPAFNTLASTNLQ